MAENDCLPLAVAVAGLGLVAMGFIPALDDPFHREGKVGFWTWAYREIYELLYGEVDGMAEEAVIF